MICRMSGSAVGGSNGGYRSDGLRSQPRDVDIVAVLVDGFGSTLKVCSHKSDAITLTPFETNPHSARMFHTSRIAIMGGPVEIVQRNTGLKRQSQPASNTKAALPIARP
jgi:hypothetical protein